MENEQNCWTPQLGMHGKLREAYLVKAAAYNYKFTTAWPSSNLLINTLNWESDFCLLQNLSGGQIVFSSGPRKHQQRYLQGTNRYTKDVYFLNVSLFCLKWNPLCSNVD